MTNSGGLTPDECAELRTRFGDILGAPVDAVRSTQRGLELFVPLGVAIDPGALAPFAGATHAEVVLTTADLGKERRAVVLLPWSGLRAADRAPGPALLAPAVAAILLLAYQLFWIL
jgi:hypothetical protein